MSAEQTYAQIASQVDAGQLRNRSALVPEISYIPDRPRPRFRLRATLTIMFALSWLAFSVVVSQAWWADLRLALGNILGTLAILGIAWIPGYLYAHLLASAVLDRRAALPDIEAYPALAVVIAVFNEERALGATVAHLRASNYLGPLEIVIADDGSTDNTLLVASQLAEQYDNVRVLAVEHGGKHSALNAALMHIDTPLVATVDADTLVETGALQRIVARLLGTDGCTAVAGSLLVGNDDESLIARMQGWEYRLSIAAIKRQQALFGATLVAQGAFSVYTTKDVLAIGGWPDAIGEDILVTWRLIDSGGQIEFEPTAFARTDVPPTARGLYRQRRRWSRGMIEGLRSHGGSMVTSRRLVSHGVLINYFLPLIDVAYLCIFIPGLIAAWLFDNFLVVGPLTLAVLPMAFLLFWVMGWQGRRARSEAGVVMERHWSGFFAYLSFYRTLIAAASIAGYLQELRGRKRDW